MTMSKFKIIEEGRMSLSEMYNIQGGAQYSCPDRYHTSPNCMPTAPIYSSCSLKYESCILSSNLSCGASYKGPTGPDGLHNMNNGPFLKQ